MKAEQLKGSILQYAMQGKLVEQDPNDEPASILLERIKEEKEQLIKDKVIKQEKALPPITDDEIPFDIPSSWEWIRFADIASFLNGDRGKNYPNKNEYVDKGIPWINTGHITSDGYLTTESMNFISEEKYNSLRGGKIEIDDLVFCLRGATFGKVARIEPYEKGAIASSLMIIRLIDKSCRDFIFTLLKAPYAMEQLRKYDNGTAQPNLAAKDVAKYLIPLPPLAEQKRIVAKIEELFEKVNRYDVLEQEITVLNNSFPTDMEKSVLQYAMQGRLVEQDPNDEPASVLLEKIKEEREQLIKDKVIKREKALLPITSDEIPFEIPDTWEWVRLNEISNIGHFKSINGANIEEDVWVLDLEEIEKDSGILLDKVKKSQKSVKSNKYIFNKGNVLYGKLRPYLNKVIVADDCGYCTTEIFPLDFGVHIFSKYAKYALMSPYFLNYVNSCSYGVKMPRLGTTDAKKAVFPLPPLAEQKRIVNKIEKMNELTIRMKDSINN